MEELKGDKVDEIDVIVSQLNEEAKRINENKCS